jgi:hypothetical protein
MIQYLINYLIKIIISFLNIRLFFNRFNKFLIFNLFKTSNSEWGLSPIPNPHLKELNNIYFLYI